MSVEMTNVEDDGFVPTVVPMPDYTRDGLDAMRAFQQDVEDLEEVLWDIEAIGGQEVSKKIKRLIENLHDFEPSVTMIGQIKSGKTTLVNAMAGRPDLLPADVNPWTSVVTSLHLNLPRADNAPAATFKFFNRDEWDNLVQNGGRIGELAARSGASDELEQVRKQISAMHEQTQTRLGRKFELLLGQEHHYEHLDESLLKRYVCMGDDFEELSKAEKQGLFADITRSADLYLEAEHLPRPLCIRDTPGVNDTFMMREQITIRAIRESKICVAVLSAHQALNTTDMALIRLIASVKSRQVIIFVNRIDELSDPANQIPEIRESLIDTLAKNGGPEDAEILFGSAYWANAVLTGTLDDMSEDSRAALLNYVDSRPDLKSDIEEAQVWSLSGVPALFHAFSERIVEGAGATFLSSIRKRAINFVSALRASSSIVSLRTDTDKIQRLSNEEVKSLMDMIEKEALRKLDADLKKDFAQFKSRTDQATDRFLARAVESLLQHLEVHGDKGGWNSSPDGLRMLMRTAYQVMRRNVVKTCTNNFDETSRILTNAYGQIFDVTAESFIVQTPEIPDIPPPVTLAKTIALDLRSSWWKSWWGRRKGYRAFASGFQDLIAAEVAPIVDDLTGRQVDEIRDLARSTLEDFLSEQRVILADICAKAQISLEELHGLFGVTAQEEREEIFDLIYDELNIEIPQKGLQDAE